MKEREKRGKPCEGRERERKREGDYQRSSLVKQSALTLSLPPLLLLLLLLPSRAFLGANAAPATGLLSLPHSQFIAA